MNYIQYMKPGGTAENKKETSKFIEWLNKAGKSWKDFWDKPVTVQYAYNPHAVVGNGGTPFSSTQRRGDFATLTAAAIAIPATAAGVATVGVVPTLVGMGVGVGAGAAGSAGGSKLVELVGGDENAQEMVGDIAGFTLGAIAGGKATKATTNYLNFWNSLLSPKSIYTAMAEGMAPTTNQTYGLVKYYGPTMGKTTAAKTNANLVDFDDVVRGPIAELAAKKGITPRDLKIANDPDYVSLLEAEVARWRMNPANAGKTLVISNKALSTSTTGYNNLPSIPDKLTFVARQVLRGGTSEEAAAYYDALIENNPNLKIDNRFVSDIESGTRAAKISEAERLGIPKGQERFIANHENLILANAKAFAEKYGYDIPKTIDEVKAMYRRHNRWFRSVYIQGYLDDNPYIGTTFDLREYAPELSGLSADEIAMKFASRGYPKWLRTFDPDDIGQYADHTVFAEANAVENLNGYGSAEGTKTVMLLRPFSFKNPLTWHIDADYRPVSLSYPHLLTKGQAQIGNSGPIHEIKLATEHLIPVKIAEPTDKGTLLGEYLGNVTYKSGGTIHIKKKNRGKFTDYCGGKVTEECIRKGKNSSNPTTRKRATFALNSRRWKHEEGGKLII